MSNRPGKRAIFFVYDRGTGIGHLRRLGCLARRLQGRLSCLIVTGHRSAAHWFVPEECEYVHLPSWDSLLEDKARYWDRRPFVVLDEAGAVRLRKAILTAVVEAFEPDVIFVDHLPLGAGEELAEVIEDTRCLKYLVTRGVLNETANLRRLVFGGKAGRYLDAYYHRILVATDRKVFDFAAQYNLGPAIRGKTVHTGYVADGVPHDTVKTVREDRGLKDGDLWVVASAGGGQLGEPLIEGCLELVRAYPDVTFDIVRGPRSNIAWPRRHRDLVETGNLRLHKETHEMPFLHAGADLVISSGGYNSLLEALQGNARILCFPFWRDRRDEQYRHAARLRQFVDLEVSLDLSELPGMFARAIGSIGCGVPDRRAELDFDGAAAIERIVHRDLGLTA
ncbi:glycosyltransferase [Nonomuraea harbinensis]|uniref:Glycosyltransferase n=1 Tax=Nonomuraea harbinensis TaxID=1286938 RepID=A0ABW1BYV3_9ACTN|nr:glycosyltransferase [Nonomuraea harbinensis]